MESIVLMMQWIVILSKLPMTVTLATIVDNPRQPQSKTHAAMTSFAFKALSGPSSASLKITPMVRSRQLALIVPMVNVAKKALPQGVIKAPTVSTTLLADVSLERMVQLQLRAHKAMVVMTVLQVKLALRQVETFTALQDGFARAKPRLKSPIFLQMEDRCAHQETTVHQALHPL